MKNKSIFPMKLSVAMLTAALMITACSQKSPAPNPQQQGAKEDQKYEKVPAVLKSLESDIEKIIKELEGPAVILDEKKQEGQGGSQEEDKQKSGEQNAGGQDQQQGGSDKQGSQQDQQGSGQEGGQGGGQEASQGEGQGGGKQETQQPKPKPKDPWTEATNLINSLHYKWNGYMPEAGKKGASKMLLDNFGNSLNSLTNIAVLKDKMKTLLAVSELYSFIPDFYSLYKTKSSPEIKRIRHYTRNIILFSMTGNWNQVDNNMTNLKSSWALYKNTLDKEQQTTSGKLDYSIYELEKVIGDRNQKLTDIKGKVTLANIENLEKAQLKKAEMEDYS